MLQPEQGGRPNTPVTQAMLVLVEWYTGSPSFNEHKYHDCVLVAVSLIHKKPVFCTSQCYQDYVEGP